MKREFGPMWFQGGGYCLIGIIAAVASDGPPRWLGILGICVGAAECVLAYYLQRI